METPDRDAWGGERSFFAELERAAKGLTVADRKADAVRLRRVFEEWRRDNEEALRRYRASFD